MQDNGCHSCSKIVVRYGVDLGAVMKKAFKKPFYIFNQALSLVDLKVVKTNIPITRADIKKNQDSILACGVDKKTARRIFQFEKFLETRNLRDFAGKQAIIVEAGVGNGSTLTFLLKLQNYLGDKRAIYAFDSFEGFPKGSQNDSEEFLRHGKPEYKNFTLSFVRAKLKSHDISEDDMSRVEFIKGFIPDSLVSFNGAGISLLNCDLDLYKPTKDTLNFFWPYIVPGGVVMLDEYDIATDQVKWPGAKKAIDEFCEEMSIQLHRGFGRRAFLKK